MLHLEKISLLLVICIAVFSTTQGCAKSRAWLPDTHGKELIINSTSGKVEFIVDVADTPAAREHGFMGRNKLSENHGMLFVFDTSGRHIFWMKNTFISLDLIFFDENFLVVGIIENAQPLSLERLDVGVNSRYVLEVKAGMAKKSGIHVGATARLTNKTGHDRNIQ